MPDVELDVGTFDPDQRVQVVGLAPAEPTTQLVGVQGVRVPGVPRQVGHRGTLGRRHRLGLERDYVDNGPAAIPDRSRQCFTTDPPETCVPLRRRPGNGS